MKCATHPSLDAVAQCNHCSVGLCKECFDLFSPPLCAKCASQHNRNVAKTFYMTLGLMGALFIGALIVLLPTLPAEDALTFSICAGFFPAGWQFMNRWMAPGGGYFFAIARWMNLSMFIIFSALFGFILGPIYLYKAWKELSVIRNTSRLFTEESQKV